MINLYFVASPNVFKICIGLEEMAMPYRLIATDISQGHHLNPANIGGGLTGKLPVIVDDEPHDGGEPLTVFESGAILQYLAEKSGRFLPPELRPRLEVMQWLFWQMGGIGPIGGQLWHFRTFSPRIAPATDNSYSLNRYDHMFARLWSTMNTRLADREFLCGDYSIADMACFPWIKYMEPSEGIDAFPHIRRWRDAIAARPAVQQAYAKIVALEVGYEKNEKGVPLFPWEGLLRNVITV